MKNSFLSSMIVLCALGAPTVGWADSSPECRGVAAGVVAAMRANNEVTGDDAVDAAVLGAQRGCEAALMSSGKSLAAGSSAAGASAMTDKVHDDDDDSFWDFFGDDDDEDDDGILSDEESAGHQRIKRLRN